MGTVENADGVGLVESESCGDRLQISIKVETGKISDIRFKTFGCAAAIATSSMITELAKGMDIKSALSITNEDVAKALDGLPDGKQHCSNHAADALHAAIRDFQQREARRE